MSSSSTITTDSITAKSINRAPHVYDENAFILDRVVQLTVASIRNNDRAQQDVPALMRKLETEARRILDNKQS